MLVRIEMSGVYSRVYYSLDLGADLAFYVTDSNHATDLESKLHYRSGQSTVRSQERRDIGRRRYRMTVHDRYLATNPKTGIGERNLNSLVKSGSVGHYGRTRKNSFALAAQNARIGTPSETKVVAVYYQSRHLSGALARAAAATLWRTL